MDLAIFTIIAILVVLDLFGIFHRAGSLGFAAGYLFFVLIRMAVLNKQNETIKNTQKQKTGN